MNPNKDYYAILGVDPRAEPAVIKAAYRALAQLYHPDKVGSDRRAEATRRMAELNEAYEVLGDTGKRSAYDRVRASPRASSDARTEAAGPPPDLSRGIFWTVMGVDMLVALAISVDRKPWLQIAWEYVAGGFESPARYTVDWQLLLVLLAAGWILARRASAAFANRVKV